MAKKEKPKKPDAPPADAPAEGEEGAAVKKKMAGKTLVLFIILPAVLVLGGGGAAALMLMGGSGAAATEADAEEGEHTAPEDGHEEAAADDHDGGGDQGATGGEVEGAADVGHRLACEGGNACYYAMPKMVVNLAGTAGQRSPYMELELSLEAANGSAFNRIPELMPRLKDQLNSFLRELRVEDLNGSAGTFTLRRELLKRFNLVLDPKKIDAVLIEGMLIQ